MFSKLINTINFQCCDKSKARKEIIATGLEEDEITKYKQLLQDLIKVMRKMQVTKEGIR